MALFEYDKETVLKAVEKMIPYNEVLSRKREKEISDAREKYTKIKKEEYEKLDKREIVCLKAHKYMDRITGRYRKYEGKNIWEIFKNKFKLWYKITNLDAEFMAYKKYPEYEKIDNESKWTRRGFERDGIYYGSLDDYEYYRVGFNNEYEDEVRRLELFKKKVKNSEGLILLDEEEVSNLRLLHVSESENFATSTVMYEELKGDKNG